MQAESVSTLASRALRVLKSMMSAVAVGLALGATPLPSLAQPAVLEARKVYSDVQKRLPQLASAPFTSKRPGVSYKAEGRAWGDGTGVVKIEVIERDDSGDVVSEFYYANGALVFVFEAVKGFVEGTNRQVTRNEERFYFQDGKLTDWISGMAKDQQKNAPGSAEFREAAKSRLDASHTFLAAARKAIGGTK